MTASMNRRSSRRKNLHQKLVMSQMNTKRAAKLGTLFRFYYFLSTDPIKHWKFDKSYESRFTCKNNCWKLAKLKWYDLFHPVFSNVKNNFEIKEFCSFNEFQILMLFSVVYRVNEKRVSYIYWQQPLLSFLDCIGNRQVRI